MGTALYKDTSMAKFSWRSDKFSSDEPSCMEKCFILLCWS